jgi:tetratricopeptide (TPR) repeat protein/transglutaminase-like putative cysteine protease
LGAEGRFLVRIISAVLVAGAALSARAAFAADTLKFGPPPEWVVPQAIPPVSSKAKDKPIALLLHDQQTLLEPGDISTYAELAFKIQKPEGLAAGNLSIAWNPAFDTTTVNRLEIRRGTQVIDVLKSGQTFTTMRREPNLELAMLDGVLTANIQPEGLQEGDIVVLATTTEHADPTLKGHVETTFAPWGETQIGLAHARIAWPSNLDLKLQETGDLPAPQQSTRNGRKVYELTMRDIDPVIDPKGAPLRFKIGRIGEATDFRSWADLAKLTAPLYRNAESIPAAGPLHDELDKIRTSTADPKLRAAKALQLVQDRIRYVALSLGQGGYVPADAETTWSRRFGDCKAKTALLLGILHALGVAAEPVLVQAQAGDMIADRLPMIGLFDHVLVRAHIGGRDYWLDGTRTGDTDLDSIQVPDFGWGLPLIQNGGLIHIVPPPLEAPNVETKVTLDATAGVHAPVAVMVEQVLEGDGAVDLNLGLSSLTDAQRDEFFKASAKTIEDSITAENSSYSFDKSKRELRISIKGTAKLDWSDGFFHVPNSSVGFNPDFDRRAGPLHDVPISVSHPLFTRNVTILRLPAGFFPPNATPPLPVNETLAGMEYRRTSNRSGDVFTVETVERSLVSEVPYKEALAVAPRLKALSDEDISLRIPAIYKSSAADLEALAKEQPSSADELVTRGNTFLDAAKFDQAIADFTKALSIDPKNVSALADRGLAYIYKKDLASAEKDLVAAETIDPDNAIAARARGLIAERNLDWAKAIDHYTRSLRREPGNDFALGHRATAEAALSKDAEALSDSDLALKAAPSWMDLRVLRANIFSRSGRNDAVADEARLLTEQNPTSDFAFVAAGKIYAHIGRHADAAKAFDHALSIKPAAYIYVNRAQSRLFSDKAGRLADLDAALKLEPDNPDALGEKAEELAASGEYVKAIELYDELIKAEPDSDYNKTQRAVLLYKTGRIAEAERVLADEDAKAKTGAEFNSLCWAKATAGIMLDSALQDCRQALKLSSGKGAYLDSSGMVLLKLGKLDEALDAYNMAVAKNTGADSLMGRAMVYARKGDRMHAEADAEAARKMYPEIDAIFRDYGLKLSEASAATH